MLIRYNSNTHLKYISKNVKTHYLLKEPTDTEISSNYLMTSLKGLGKVTVFIHV